MASRFCGSLFLFQNLYISINSRSAHIADPRKIGDIKFTAYVRWIMPVKYRRYILFGQLRSAYSHAFCFGVRHSRSINKINWTHHIPSLKFLCRQFSKYLLQPSSKVIVVPLAILIFCIAKSSLKTKKYWTHHERKYVYDVSNFLLFNFVRNEFYKARIKLCKS